MIKKIIVFFSLSFFLSLSISALSKEVLISVDSQTYNKLFEYQIKMTKLNSFSDINLVKIDEDHLGFLSYVAHKDFGKCGGYIFEEHPLEAAFNLSQLKFNSQEISFKIKERSNSIASLIEEVKADNIRDIILKLSSFKNRYYRSSHGQSSQKWLFDFWAQLAEGRDDITVEKIKHNNYGQPSIVLTITGLSLKDEYVILGGHGDSTAGWGPAEYMEAPGADDNASGIATLTEILRLIIKKGYRPERTIQFISYAAEEVGLRGSGDIARTYARDNKNVKAVLQFDMTNFSSSEYDIVFIRDYTTAALTEYLISLLDMYLPDLKWGSDKCGYACSDHASWYRNGFPVAFPFESTFSAHNRKIHTRGDLISVSGDTAVHAAKFAKLGLAFSLDASKK